MRIKLTILERVKKTNRICIVGECNKAPAPGHNFCHKHRMANFKKNRPRQYAYNVYKQNQKKANRGAITFAEYIKTNY